MFPNLKNQFFLDPKTIFLNHGSFGACAKPIYQNLLKWQKKLEKEPVKFFEETIFEALQKSREALGQYINCSEMDLIFFQNPTTAINAVAKSIKLEDGDNINIGSKTNLVILKGEINTPGNYQYMPGDRLDKYIKMAGGFTKDAARFATFIQYPNGTSEAIGLFKFSPVVLDGSIITVGRKEEVEPFNFTEYVASLTGFWADLSQAWLMIILALKA